MGTLGIFLQYSDPRPPPLLSHGALISTDQAFTLLKMRAVCFHMHIGLNAKKKNKGEKSCIYKPVYRNLCKDSFKGLVMILIICDFSFEILYES